MFFPKKILLFFSFSFSFLFCFHDTFSVNVFIDIIAEVTLLQTKGYVDLNIQLLFLLLFYLWRYFFLFEEVLLKECVLCQSIIEMLIHYFSTQRTYSNYDTYAQQFNIVYRWFLILSTISVCLLFNKLTI